MNRLFHARIRWYQYALLSLLGAGFLSAFWYKQGVWAVLLAVLLILVIERIIHTLYTITTDGYLVVYHGRFVREKKISIQEISAVNRSHSMKFGSFSVTHYLLVEYGDGKFISLCPDKEQEFIDCIEKHKKK
ncbi:MAG: ABC transporter [Bacteroidia bacterium]|nr:ABC transporter [Bacteroidia bacterium]